jgi:hypothetical protein
LALLLIAFEFPGASKCEVQAELEFELEVQVEVHVELAADVSHKSNGSGNRDPSAYTA